MSNSPGLRNQESLRVVFRVAGVVLLVAAFACLFVAVREFFTLEGFEQPTHFWLMFVGIPLLAVSGWCLQAGFLGAAARFTAGETMPVVRDAASYLSDGEGVLGVGRTVDDAPAKVGSFCSRCGVRNDEGAKFCDACGNALA